MRLRLRARELDAGAGRPVLMGIVNATPDSFSDPGRRTPEEQAEHGARLVADGAALIDVGGESGRTDRAAVPAEEEIARVVPVVERLVAAGHVVSVDTWRAPVARAALAAGASAINDPSGLTDPGVADACAEVGAGLVLTHASVRPKEEGFPGHDDVVGEVASGLGDLVERATAGGVAEESLMLDPGIDLGKTPAESVELLRRLGELAAMGRPLLLAISRKDVIGALTGRPPSERGAGTLAAVEASVEGGAAIVRVHDVRAAADYLRVRAVLRGEADVPPGLRLAEDLRREAAA